MTNIEITQPNPETGGTSVIVDGVDLSNSLRSLTAEFIGSDPARVTVEVALYEHQRLCMADAELIIGEDTVAMLERHGWTRPVAAL